MSATPAITGSVTLTGASPATWHNLDNMTVTLYLSQALGFPSAFWLVVKSPTNQTVIAQEADISPNLAVVSTSFVLGDPFWPWPAGTYEGHLYADISPSSALPLDIPFSFQYVA